MLDIDVSKMDLAQTLKDSVEITRIDLGSDATGNMTVGNLDHSLKQDCDIITI